MQIRIHRGATQIGGTCIEVAHEGTRLALDLGLPLDGDAADRSLVPQIAGDDLAAVLISHPHLDHYGLLHHLPAHTPVAMGAAARRIIRAAAPFTGQALPKLEGPVFHDRETLEIGTFRITPYLVDHSAFDAYALLIEAGGKRVFYSGDFRAHGRKGGLFERLVAHPPGDIEVLLMEGSSLSRLDERDHFPSEAELEAQMLASIGDYAGLVMVHTSAQNIDRMVTLYRVAKQTGRTLVIDLYTAAVLAATGHPSIPQSSWPQIALYVPELQRRQIKREGWFDLLKAHSAQRIFMDDITKMADKVMLLYRPLLIPDLERAQCLQNARFIYGQWLGYFEQGSYASTKRLLERHGIKLEYVHTSGHASPGDLQRFAKSLTPKSLVPIHSFAPDKYPNLFDNVVLRNDGEWWDV